MDQSSVRYILPLPIGSYLITYSASLPDHPGGLVQCYISEVTLEGFSRTTAIESQNRVTGDGGALVALNGAGHATKTAEQNIEVNCNTDGATWSQTAGNPLTITATPTVLTEEAINPFVTPG